MDDPVVMWIEKTGYPKEYQEKPVVCDFCGEIIEETIYTDDEYENLCEDCLLILHEKSD